MEKFIKGSIVVVPFPFSDLSNSKKRPALVLANLKGDDIILCQITSRFSSDMYAVLLTNEDLQRGSLITNSYVRPNRIFTADQNIILKSVAQVNNEKMVEIINKIFDILR